MKLLGWSTSTTTEHYAQSLVITVLTISTFSIRFKEAEIKDREVITISTKRSCEVLLVALETKLDFAALGHFSLKDWLYFVNQYQPSFS